MAYDKKTRLLSCRRCGLCADRDAIAAINLEAVFWSWVENGTRPAYLDAPFAWKYTKPVDPVGWTSFSPPAKAAAAAPAPAAPATAQAAPAVPASARTGLGRAAAARTPAVSATAMAAPAVPALTHEVEVRAAAAPARHVRYCSGCAHVSRSMGSVIALVGTLCRLRAPRQAQRSTTSQLHGAPGRRGPGGVPHPH